MMFTDGVTEAMAEDESMYEEPRLEAYLENHHTYSNEQLVRGLIVDVLKFTGKAEQSDDITVLSLGYNG